MTAPRHGQEAHRDGAADDLRPERHWPTSYVGIDGQPPTVCGNPGCAEFWPCCSVVCDGEYPTPEGVPRFICTLMAGHDGWHKSITGASWNFVPEMEAQARIEAALVAASIADYDATDGRVIEGYVSELARTVIATGWAMESVAKAAPADPAVVSWEPAPQPAEDTDGAADDGMRALVREALHLCMHGERAPGGDETWSEWCRKAEATLRAAPEPAPLPQPSPEDWPVGTVMRDDDGDIWERYGAAAWKGYEGIADFLSPPLPWTRYEPKGEQR